MHIDSCKLLSSSISSNLFLTRMWLVLNWQLAVREIAIKNVGDHLAAQS